MCNLRVFIVLLALVFPAFGRRGNNRRDSWYHWMNTTMPAPTNTLVTSQDERFVVTVYVTVTSVVSIVVDTITVESTTTVNTTMTLDLSPVPRQSEPTNATGFDNSFSDTSSTGSDPLPVPDGAALLVTVASVYYYYGCPATLDPVRTGIRVWIQSCSGTQKFSAIVAVFGSGDGLCYSEWGQ